MPPTSKKKSHPATFQTPPLGPSHSHECEPSGDVTTRNGAETCETPLKTNKKKKQSKYLFL